MLKDQGRQFHFGMFSVSLGVGRNCMGDLFFSPVKDKFQTKAKGFLLIQSGFGDWKGLF